ncbi:MAG: shikimate dehydrogenase [Deltaproteobacteria bacterium]|nr:shikimate dehydrogenase [Deltaproteobacteria bacterium]
MNSEQQLFALFGNPVQHSLSPLMHNAVFDTLKLDARYIALRVENARDIIVHMRRMNITGASITIPHKTALMKYLDEFTDSSRRIGAVNTVVHSDGTMKGDNTDWIGLTCALRESLTITGKTFAILGAGGAARAVVFGILEEGGTSVIFNRTTRKGEMMAREFGCEFHPMEDIGKISADCLINTTPVGLSPDAERSTVSKDILPNFAWVMDIIYNPLKTKLLQDAEESGCSIISGLSMFVHQGAEQLKIWMNVQPPLDFMKKVILEKLRNEGS